MHYAFDILALCFATFVFLAVVVDLVLLSHVAVVEAAKDAVLELLLPSQSSRLLGRGVIGLRRL